MAARRALLETSDLPPAYAKLIRHAVPEVRSISTTSRLAYVDTPVGVVDGPRAWPPAEASTILVPSPIHAAVEKTLPNGWKDAPDTYGNAPLDGFLPIPTKRLPVCPQHPTPLDIPMFN